MKIHDYINEISDLSISEKFNSDLNKNYSINSLLRLYNEDDFILSSKYKKIGNKNKLLEKMIEILKIKNKSICQKYNDEALKQIILDQIIFNPSEVAKKFQKFKNKKEAFEWFDNFSYFSNYKKPSKNIKYHFNDLEISINLLKPEIVKKKSVSTKKREYPFSLLAKENVGYFSYSNYPTRITHRIIPLKLMNQEWFFQYSPYEYMNKHGIVFTKKKFPMSVGIESIKAVVSFVEKFPFFNAFSNSDKQGTGASILNHMHFQVGMHDLPFKKASKKLIIKNDNVSIYHLNWYVEGFLVKSHDKISLIKTGDKIIKLWKNFKSIPGILLNNKNNTVSYAVVKRGKTYNMYIFLRNNSLNNNGKLIYSQSRKFYAIKKEGIGIIEVLGMGIFPARLKNELENLKDQKNQDWKIWKKWIFLNTNNHKIENMLYITYQNILKDINIDKENNGIINEMVKLINHE